MEETQHDAIERGWARAGRALLDFLLPPLCPLSEDPVTQPGDLSAEAWGKVHFIAPPVCARCGVPFAYDRGEGAVCGACAAEEPPYGRLRAVFVYDDRSRELILRFKHGVRQETAPAFGRWMARAGRELLDRADYIAPTPLHWRRLLSRRFNQAALLARAVAQAHGEIAFAPDLLSRIRATPSQGGLSAKGRRRNVAGAFAAPERWKPRLEGKTVILVDDVVTTGATLAACAKALRRAGAARIDALALARTVPGRQDAL
ncbi:MAG: ComF family protein [Parvularculaceae bacterium]